MRQRNRLLDDGARDDAQFRGLEEQLAEAGVAMAAARLDAVAALNVVAERRRAERPIRPFRGPMRSLRATLRLS